MTQTASEKIVERVTTWPGVQARPGRDADVEDVIAELQLNHDRALLAREHSPRSS